MNMDRAFVERFLQRFKLNQHVRPVLLKWATKMLELLVFGLPKEQWATEIYQLHRYCQRNKLPQFSSFDPLEQFSAFMEEWRHLIIDRNQKNKVVNHQKTEYTEQQFPSLTDLLLDNLNLNMQCEAELQHLERRLIQQIKAGSKLEYSVSQVRKFCREHAGEKGFYDERGRLAYLVGVWYDIVNDSYSAEEQIQLAIEDDSDFDSIMRDITDYVNQSGENNAALRA